VIFILRIRIATVAATGNTLILDQIDQDNYNAEVVLFVLFVCLFVYYYNHYQQRLMNIIINQKENEEKEKEKIV
jgi:hypothetical protein